MGSNVKTLELWSKLSGKTAKHTAYKRVAVNSSALTFASSLAAFSVERKEENLRPAASNQREASRPASSLFVRVELIRCFASGEVAKWPLEDAVTHGPQLKVLFAEQQQHIHNKRVKEAAALSECYQMQPTVNTAKLHFIYKVVRLAIQLKRINKSKTS